MILKIRQKMIRSFYFIFFSINIFYFINSIIINIPTIITTTTPKNFFGLSNFFKFFGMTLFAKQSSNSTSIFKILLSYFNFNRIWQKKHHGIQTFIYNKFNKICNDFINHPNNPLNFFKPILSLKGFNLKINLQRGK